MKNTHSTKKRLDIREKIQEIAELYRSGKTSRQLGEQFLVDRKVITKCLKDIGVTIRGSHKRKGILPWNKGIQYLAIKGDKNPNWKGGVTPLNQQVRHCLKYKYWIKAVFERDNYTCVLCTKKGGNLEADHYPKNFCQIMLDNNIKTLAKANECSELWDINNGRTVCMKCHKRGNIRPVKSRFKKFSNRM